MSATEILRCMLDEREVHWWAGEDERKTLWESNGLTWEYFNDENGDAWLGFLGACESDVTPEQAIAATLGATDAKPTKAESSETCHQISCNCSSNCSDSERTETCHITDNGPWGYPYVCSECGASFDPDVNRCGGKRWLRNRSPVPSAAAGRSTRDITT